MNRRNVLFGSVAAATSLLLPSWVGAAGETPRVLTWTRGGVNPFEGTPHEAIDFLLLPTPQEREYAHEAVDKWFTTVGYDPKHPMVAQLQDGDEWLEMGNGPREKRVRWSNVIVRESTWDKEREGKKPLPREYFIVPVPDHHRGTVTEVAIPKVCGNPLCRRRKKGSVKCIPLPERIKRQAPALERSVPTSFQLQPTHSA